MINFVDLPIYPQTEEQERETWNLCIRDGTTARRFGWSITQCPPYKNPDMAVSWKMGWRREDERLRRKKDD